MHVNWYTFLYKQEKTCHNYAENIRSPQELCTAALGHVECCSIGHNKYKLHDMHMYATTQTYFICNFRNSFNYV